MINTKVFLGLPLNFHDQFDVYPPTIEDVIQQPHFNMYRPLFCLSQEEVEDEMLSKNSDVDKFLTPLEFLMSLCYNNKDLEKIAREGFKFFTHLPMTFLYSIKTIAVGDIEKMLPQIKNLDELTLIKEDNFFDLQNLIRIAIGDNPVEPSDPNENPRIKQMKAKARYRDRIKAKQKKGGASLQGSIEVLCCMEMGLNPLNVGKVPYAAIGPLINRYQRREKYHIDIDSLMAGAKSSKVHPKDWILDET